jgi:hypothetical protein
MTPRTRLATASLAIILLLALSVPAWAAPSEIITTTRDMACVQWEYVEADGSSVWVAVYQRDEKILIPAALGGSSWFDRRYSLCMCRRDAAGDLVGFGLFSAPASALTLGPDLKGSRIRAGGTMTWRAADGTTSTTPVSFDVTLSGAGDVARNQDSWLEGPDELGKWLSVTSDAYRRSGTCAGSVIVNGQALPVSVSSGFVSLYEEKQEAVYATP